MNLEITLEFWTRFFGRVAVETALVALLAAGVQRWIKSAGWRRTIWQTALLGMVLLLAGELTGVSGAVAGWSRLQTTPKQSISAPPALRTTAATTASAAIVSTGATELPVTPAVRTPEPEPSRPVTAVWWPAWVWVLGMLVIMTWVLVPRLLFWRLRQRWGQAVTDERLLRCVGTLAGQLRIRRPVRVIQRSSLSGPVAFGWWRPTVGLPENLETDFTPAQREVMLAHELAHLAAHDPAWHLLADLACALLWWQPLAWWSRGRLLSASEMAADEASQLLVHGPGTLAECLVVMGRRLSQPAAGGWQRIEGRGFRSHLGRRVERLLDLPEHPSPPCGPARRWLGIAGGLITVSVLAVTGVAWLTPSSLAGDLTAPKTWRQSWQGSLAAWTLTAAVSPADPGRPVDDNLARGSNTAADKTEDYIAITYRVDEETLIRQIQQRLNRHGGTNELPQLVRDYLAQVANLAAPPKAVVLNRRSGMLLICVRSIDFKAIDRTLKSLISPESFEDYGISFSPRRAVTDPVLLYTRVFKVDPNTFIQGLQGITGMPPLPDMGKGGGNGFRSVTPETGAQDVQDLVRRFFNAILGAQFGVPQTQGNLGQPGSGIGAMGQKDKVPVLVDIPLLGQLFRSEKNSTSNKNLYGAGGGLNAQGTTSESTRTLFFKDRTGQLFVRATMAELDMIEMAIQCLNTPPAQVCVEVKFVEIDQDDSKGLGVDGLLGNILMDAGGSVSSFTGIPGAPNPLGVVPSPGKGGIPPGVFDKALTNGWPQDNAGSVWRILTVPQSQLLLKNLEQRAGAQVMSVPRVTTLTGRQAQIYVGTPYTNVRGPNLQELRTNKISTGFTTDVIPRVLPGYAIEMTLNATLIEFLGYMSSEKSTARGAATARTESNPPTNSLNLKPQFRGYQAGVQITVWDGQTAVLEAMPKLVTLNAETRSPNDPQIETSLFFASGLLSEFFPQARPDNLSSKRLLVLVTPTIVDPAGNRVNTGDNSPFDPNTTPPQSGTR